MTRKSRKSLLAISVLAMSFSVCGAVASFNFADSVNAKAEYVAPVDFETRLGASMRISEPNGLRFKLNISDARKQEIFAENSGKTLGMFIFPKSKLTSTEISATDHVDYSKLSKKIDLTFTESDLHQQDGNWVANGVIGDMYIQNYNLEFVGVGYVKTGDTYEYSTFNADDNVRSLSGIAMQAYKANDAKTKAAEFIEKGVYAKYGVRETRTTDGETVTDYTFTANAQSYTAGDSWSAYNAMKEANPIAISVAQVGEISIGESVRLVPTFTVNGTTVDMGDCPFTYTVSSDAVTCDNDGVVRGMATGSAEITVTMGKVTATTSVTVLDNTVQHLAPITYYANRDGGNGLSIDLSAYNVTGASKFMMDGVEYACALNGTTLTVAENLLANVDGGVKEISITDSTGKALMVGKLTYVNFALGTADEFVEFQQLYGTKRGTTEDRSTKYTYVILTDNIDMAGTNLSYSATACKFYGHLDGQGYTVDNFIASNSIFWHIGDRTLTQRTVVENVGFTNVQKSVKNAGGVLAFEIFNADIDNVYVQVDVIATDGSESKYIGAITDYAYSGTSITNSFVEISSEFATHGALVARAKDKAKIKNCYAISTSTAVAVENRYAYSEVFSSLGSDGIFARVTDGLYTSVDAFKTEVNAIPRGFDTSYWVMQNGMLTFKSTQGTWITLEDTYTVAANKTDTLVIDLSAHSSVIQSISSITIGGTTVAGYTYNNNTLSIPFANITARGNVELVANGTTKAGGNLIVTAKTQVVDMAIANVDDLNAFGAFCNVGITDGVVNRTAYTYVVLTANINYNNALWSDVYSAGYFSGVFDGQGYSIRNVRVVNSFFPGTTQNEGKLSVIKNVALINVVKHSLNGGGLLVNDLLNTKIDNVYVSGRVELYTNPNVCGVFAGTSIYSTISNSVASIEYLATQGTMPSLIGQVKQSTTTISNVHVVSANASNNFVGLVNTTDNPGVLQLNNVKRYNTDVEFKAAVTQVPATFDAEYWTMRDNMLTFKSGAWLTLAKTQVFAGNRNNKIDLAQYNVSSVSSVTVGGVTVAGYTYTGGQLGIPADIGFKTTDPVDAYVTATNDSGELTIAFKAQVVDFAIGTATELKQLAGYIGEHKIAEGAEVNYYAYVILTASVDYEGGNFNTDSDQKGFNGCFDGQGYAISNVNVTNGFFQSVRGVNSTTNPAIIKDVAFVNVMKATPNGGGFLANYLCNVVVSNVFVSGVLVEGTSSSGAVYGYGTYVKMENCVFDLYFANNNQQATLVNTLQTGCSFTNVHAISTRKDEGTTTFYTGTATNVNSAHYTSLTAFKSITNVPTGFDLTLWEMQEGLLVFKSAGTEAYLSK